MKKKYISVIISLSIVIGIVITGNILYFGTDLFKPATNQTDYSWETDPQRFTFPESIHNVTLNISYGIGNNYINETYNLSLTGHYTTVFDIMNSCCTLEYEIFWWIHPTFFITGINGVLENEAENLYWVYEVNGSYVAAGVNAYCPGNNSFIQWFYG
jgi:hypothetical protein